MRAVQSSLVHKLLPACAIALALFGVSSAAQGQAALLTGFGGPAGFGDYVQRPGAHPWGTCVGTCGRNDDGWTGPIAVAAAFPAPGLRFVGAYYTSFFLNTNGNFTFGAGLSQFTPTPFPIAMQPMIAPYWADVDTRGGVDPNDIFLHIAPGLIVATWNNVGYYSSHHNLRNSFQLIIRSVAGCGIGDFSVEFRYNRCEWTTGDASGGTGGSGGTPAQVGFDAGNLTDYLTLPGSRTAAVLNLCRTSNVGMTGVWRFTVRGGALPCVGSGERCDIPTNVGACREGVQQCRGAMTTCVQTVRPSMERCDGIDNDCNGMTDEGMGLCPADSVCDRGSCVPRCVEGACFEGQMCNSRGFCEETACIGRMCPAGQRCRGGNCVGACDGIYCPPPSVCRSGRCVDPCMGMMCMTGEVCEAGRCVPHCRCRSCDTGHVCNMGDGHCVPMDCAGVTCPAGAICRAGRCIDPCVPPPDQRACPDDQMCAAGVCVTRVGGPDSGMTGDDAAVVGDVVRPGDDAGPTDDVASTGDGGGTADGGTGRDGGLIREEGGCRCRAAGSVPSGRNRGLAWIAGLGIAAVALARRRHR